MSITPINSMKSKKSYESNSSFATTEQNYRCFQMDFLQMLKKKENQNLEAIINKVDERKKLIKEQSIMDKSSSFLNISFGNFKNQMNDENKDNTQNRKITYLNQGFPIKSKMYFQKRALSAQYLQNKYRQEIDEKYKKNNRKISELTKILVERSRVRKINKDKKNQNRSHLDTAAHHHHIPVTRNHTGNMHVSFSQPSEGIVSQTINEKSKSTRQQCKPDKPHLQTWLETNSNWLKNKPHLQTWLETNSNWLKNVIKKKEDKRRERENLLLTEEKSYFLPRTHTSKNKMHKTQSRIHSAYSDKIYERLFNYNKVIQSNRDILELKNTPTFTPDLYHPKKWSKKHKSFNKSVSLIPFKERKKKLLDKIKYNKERSILIHPNNKTPSKNKKGNSNKHWTQKIKSANQKKNNKYGIDDQLYRLNVRTNVACEYEKSSVLYSNKCSFIPLNTFFK